MAWQIIVVEPVRSWLHALRMADRETLMQVSNAIDILALEGPALGRPASGVSRRRQQGGELAALVRLGDS